MRDVLDDHQSVEVEELDLREPTFIIAEYIILIVGVFVVIFWVPVWRISFYRLNNLIRVIGGLLTVLSIMPMVFTLVWRIDTKKTVEGDLHPQKLLRPTMQFLHSLTWVFMIISLLILIFFGFKLMTNLFSLTGFLNDMLAYLIVLIIFGIHWFYFHLVTQKIKALKELYIYR